MANLATNQDATSLRMYRNKMKQDCRNTQQCQPRNPYYSVCLDLRSPCQLEEISSVSSKFITLCQIKITMENGHVEWFCSLKMLVFHSYVQVPELGKPPNYQTGVDSSGTSCSAQDVHLLNIPSSSQTGLGKPLYYRTSINGEINVFF